MTGTQSFFVRFEVNRTYQMWIEATDEEEAFDLADAMDTTEISERASLKDVEVTHVEVILDAAGGAGS